MAEGLALTKNYCWEQHLEDDFQTDSCSSLYLTTFGVELASDLTTFYYTTFYLVTARLDAH